MDNFTYVPGGDKLSYCGLIMAHMYAAPSRRVELLKVGNFSQKAVQIALVSFSLAREL